MKKTNSLDRLNIPRKQLKFLIKYLTNISRIHSINRVILFGSCAKGYAKSHSDIDLMIIGDTINGEDETEIYCRCIPDVPNDEYVSIDIITCTPVAYERHKTRLGYIERQVERDGIDISSYMANIYR